MQQKQKKYGCSRTLYSSFTYRDGEEDNDSEDEGGDGDEEEGHAPAELRADEPAKHLAEQDAAAHAHADHRRGDAAVLNVEQVAQQRVNQRHRTTDRDTLFRA